ncbi:MAG TPA: hypothetical protein VFW66_01295 [Gemmatimonadales bacterium]|nr:hypothetical protein [Gemmatimonadales bacterium]
MRACKRAREGSRIVRLRRAAGRLAASQIAAALIFAAPAAALTAHGGCGGGLVAAVRDFVVGQLTPAAGHSQTDHLAPRLVPPSDPGGPSVDLTDLSHPELIERRIHDAAPRLDSALRLTVPNGSARLGDYTIGSAETVTGHLLVMEGDADVYGKLLGNLVTLDGDVVVHPGAVVSGDVLALGGAVTAAADGIGGEVRTLQARPPRAPAPVAQTAPSGLVTTGRDIAGVIGVFLALLTIGAGLVLFARPHLEIVSDTVSHSFGRSLVTGLLGQILLLPTFGMLVVGLVLSVAGILLLPFAVVVYVLLVIVGVLGGYLAVAHAVGETYVRRRMARGAALGSPNSYRYLLAGLVGLFILWAAWAIFGWVPLAGELIRGAAVLVTWLLATAGFGAALLSRAGLRANFAGRLIPAEALTDEYLWATPQFGVPAARRPERGTGRGTGSS